MEGNNNADNTSQQPENKPPDVPLQPQVDSSLDSTSDKSHTNHEQNKRRKKIKWKEYIGKWFEPLNISTIVLALFTYWLFRDAVAQGESQHESHISDSISNDKRFRLDSNNLANQIRIAEENVQVAKDANKLSDSISRIALQQQISTLKETQNEFEEENRPFMQIADLKFDTLALNKKVQVSFNIVNMGKFPGKVRSLKYRLSIGKSNKIEDFDKLSFLEEVSYSTIISNEATINLTVSTRDIADSIFMEKYKKGELYIYISGEMKYETLLRKERTFTNYFIFKMAIYPRINIITIRNEDI